MVSIFSFVELLNRYRNHVDRVLIVYALLATLHVIIFVVAAYKGYMLHHTELSVLVIMMNFVNVIYYSIVKHSIYEIFGRHSTSSNIQKYMIVIRNFTYFDILMNLTVFIVVTVLFILWVDDESSIDRSLMIFEYVSNTLVNIFTVYSCTVNIYQLKSLFNRNQTTSFDCTDNNVVSPINEV